MSVNILLFIICYVVIGIIITAIAGTLNFINLHDPDDDCEVGLILGWPIFIVGALAILIIDGLKDIAKCTTKYICSLFKNKKIDKKEKEKNQRENRELVESVLCEVQKK